MGLEVVKMSARYSDCDGINYEGQLRLSRFAREVPADYFLHVARAGIYCVNKERERHETKYGWSWLFWVGLWLLVLASFWLGR